MFQCQGHNIKSIGNDAYTCQNSQSYVVGSFQEANFIFIFFCVFFFEKQKQSNLIMLIQVENLQEQISGAMTQVHSQGQGC